jgi:hypothetical protein
MSDRETFVPRKAIEYVMNDGKLEVALDQVITVSPEPLQPSPEEREANASADAAVEAAAPAGRETFTRRVATSGLTVDAEPVVSTETQTTTRSRARSGEE